MKTLLSVAFAGLLAVTLSGCADCHGCIKAPPCCPKKAVAPEAKAPATPAPAAMPGSK